ncbi:MAG: hypothetical protein JXA99_09340 [Candidatus Lokiarchaeota archaeon]|nr:hypothetical protein [Candidatus Lokiarchaeota archaeon]
MVLDPFIGIVLFLEGMSNEITAIFLYLSLFAGLFTLIGAILARNDYTPLGIDYLKLSINTLRISLLIGFIGIIIFNALVAIPSIEHPLDLSLLYILLYNTIEVIFILIIIFISIKLNKRIKTHNHGDKFKHHT